MSLATVVAVGISSAFLVDSVAAEPSSESEVKAEREEIKAELSEAESKIADVLFEIEEVNDELKKVEGALKENKDLQTETETKISKNEKEIKVIQKRIEERTDILKERMLAYQQNGGDTAYLEVLLGAKSFNEFISNASAVSKISNADIALAEEHEADKNAVEEKLNEQKEEKSKLKEMAGIIKEQKESAKKNKKKLEKKEEKLTALKADLESEDSALASLEAEIRQNMASSNTATASNSNSNSTNDDSEGNVSTLSNSSSNSSKKSPSTDSSPKSSGGKGMSAVINAGNRFIGNSTYVFGAADPAGGRFDCSGFVNWAFAQGGYSVPRTTGALASTGKAVSPNDMQPGDLVFFNTNGHNGHVGIYIGGGNFIGSQSSTGVAVANMKSGYWAGQFSGTVRRVN